MLLLLWLVTIGNTLRQLTNIATILLTLWLSGCSLESHSTSPSPAPTSPASSASSVAAPAAPSLPGTGAESAVPLEVSLAPGTTLPGTLAASTLVISFQATVATATFQCLSDWSEQWLPCNGGASYDFGKLIDFRGYTLKVRAVAGGITSDPPLLITFVVNMTQGVAPTLPAGTAASAASSVLVPTDATILPAPAKALVSTTKVAAAAPSTSTTPAASTSRVLQVGTYYALNVPASGEVTGYATTETYNADILTMTVMTPGLSSFLSTPTCTLSFEKIVTTADGTQYCQGTPTEAQLTALAGGTIPANFIDVALPSATSQVGEKLLVASFDSVTDPGMTTLSLSGRCPGGLSQGSMTFALLPQFYATAPAAEKVSWCETTGGGRWWWIGVVTAQLGSSSSHLEFLYTVDTGLGILTSTQFVDRLTTRLGQMLQPIAPYSP